MKLNFFCFSKFINKILLFLFSNRFLSDNNLNRITPQTFNGLKNIRTLMLRTNKLTYIKNDTFFDMDALKTLSLYDNRIKCIAPGSFDRLKSLSTL
jgi:Leucine-rich repeat (LRR) protein